MLCWTVPVIVVNISAKWTAASKSPLSFHTLWVHKFCYCLRYGFHTITWQSCYQILTIDNFHHLSSTDHLFYVGPNKNGEFDRWTINRPLTHHPVAEISVGVVLRLPEFSGLTIFPEVQPLNSEDRTQRTCPVPGQRWIHAGCFPDGFYSGSGGGFRSVIRDTLDEFAAHGTKQQQQQLQQLLSCTPPKYTPERNAICRTTVCPRIVWFVL